MDGSAEKLSLNAVKQKSKVSFGTSEEKQRDSSHIIKNPDGTMIYSHYRK